MDVRVTGPPEAFDLPEWRQLHEKDPHRHLFSLPEWARVWWEEFGTTQEVLVLTFLDPEPVGLAALTRDSTARGVRLRFLGGEDLTDYLGPVAADHHHLPKIADALLAYLRSDIGEWDYFDAQCLPVPFQFAEWLVEAADRHGLDFELDQEGVTAVLPLQPTFEGYLKALPGKKRHELRRKMRRFEESVSQHRLVTATTETAATEAWGFVEAHRSSEGPKGGFMRPRRARFFSRLARTFSSLGLLSLDSLEVGGEWAASMFSFRYEGVFYVYNSAYNHSMSRVSPGLVLAARLVERSIAEGLRVVDFLKGGERYKFDLGAEALPLHRVQIATDGPG